MEFLFASATVVNRSGMLSLKPATGYVFVSADIRVIPNRIHSIPYRYRCCMEQAIFEHSGESDPVDSTLSSSHA